MNDVNPILAALLCQVGIGDSQEPDRPIKNLPRFVTDTIFPAVGGPFRIERRVRPSNVPSNVAAALTIPGRPLLGDTVVSFFKELTIPWVAHEAGHVLYHRGIPLPVMDAVDKARARYDRPNDHFGFRPKEYIAEAFARAIQSGRKGFTDSTKVDRQFPGAIEFIRWLQTRPPFARPAEPQADSPLAKQLNPLLGKHPSVGRVNTMVGLGLAANLAISRLHNRHFRRIAWAVILGAELKAVSGNIVSGVRMRFDF